MLSMNPAINPAPRAPTHHPPEELLLDLATGAASASEALMLEAHLAYCRACRDAVRDLEDAGGALLTILDPVSLPPNALNRALRAIELSEGLAPVPEAPSASAVIDANLARTDWRKVPGGFRMRRVDAGLAAQRAEPGRSPSGRVWLFEAPAKMKVFQHRHVGDEWTVVLSGEFHDGGECYKAGDFAWLPENHRHQPVMGADAPCVGLILVRDSPVYTSVVGKIAAPFIRI